MPELIYRDTSSNNREAKEVKFQLPNDLTVNEFKIMCVRLAASIGYSYKSIQDTFGKESEVISSDEKTKLLLESLGIVQINEPSGSVNEK